jgi:hypothetical protein
MNCNTVTEYTLEMFGVFDAGGVAASCLAPQM